MLNDVFDKNIYFPWNEKVNKLNTKITGKRTTLVMYMRANLSVLAHKYRSNTFLSSYQFLLLLLKKVGLLRHGFGQSRKCTYK